MRMTRMRCILPAIVMLTGCAAVGPDYEPPALDMPDAWLGDTPAGAEIGWDELRAWWTLFDDPVLIELVERSLEGSLDLALAVARIEESRAIVGIVSGEQFPRLDADASYTRIRPREIDGLSRDTKGFTAVGLSASWELDLFGRIRRSIEATEADLSATIEDYHGVQVLLTAEVAQAYIDIRSFQERIRLAEANIDAQRETREIARQLVRGGLGLEIDLAQAESNVATSEAALPLLKAGLSLTVFRLSVLLGEMPETMLAVILEPAPLPTRPRAEVTSIPASILEQRPDIRGAERRLAASTARVGVAVADLYPRVSLLGDLSFNGRTLTDTLVEASLSYSFGPSVTFPIFQGGSLRANISAQEARTKQALIELELTVLDALEEVESALVSHERELERRDALERAVGHVADTVALADERYRVGEDDFQPVLIAQRSLLVLQDQLATSRALVLTHTIALYRSLGGGWAADPGDGAGPPATSPPS